MTEETLSDVDHTHPFTGETFGGVYRRGPAVADGAGPAVGADGPAGDVADERLADVAHAPGDVDATAATELWKRGRAVGAGAPAERPETTDGAPDGDDGR